MRSWDNFNCSEADLGRSSELAHNAKNVDHLILIWAEQSQPTQNSWKHNFMTLHNIRSQSIKIRSYSVKNLLTMGTMDNVLQKQSSSAAVIFTLCTLSSSFLSPQTITMLTQSSAADHPEAWEWWSLSQVSDSGSRYSGKLLASYKPLHIHKMEACISNIRIPPQQDWFAWTAVVSSKHVYSARGPHITRHTWIFHQELPEASLSA